MAIHDEDKNRTSSGLGVASLVVGITAIFACGLGLIAGPTAAALGVLSGRRGGYGGKEITGIVTGSIGFLVSAVALVWLFVYAADDDDRTITTDAPTPTASAADGDSTSEATADDPRPTLTEAGIAASEYDTAYAAYLATYGVTTEFDGVYAGEAIDTPCFTMDGEAWWITQGSPDTCAPSSELWWETSADGEDAEITLFGSGVVGAGISFDPVSIDWMTANLGATDLASLVAYAEEEMLVASGAVDIVETSTTLDGVQAVRLDGTFEGVGSYRLYVVLTPQEYEVGVNQAAGFVIHAFNEAEWIYPSEDVLGRLEGTLQWK